MKTLKFHRTECGVDFLLNVLTAKEVSKNYLSNETYNTDFYEIIFFKNATGHMILDHQKIEINDQKIVFLSPFQKRQFFLDADNLEFTVLAFQEQFLNDFFSDKLFTFRLLFFYQPEFPLSLTTEKESLERYCVLLSEIKVELLKTQADSVHIIRSIIYYLLQKLNREYAKKHNLPLEKNGNNYAFLFKKMIEIHIKEKQRITEYTELLGISRITLNKVVKEQFNVTPTYILKQRLLTEIKSYLIQNELSIAEIACQLHFSEPNHLMRFFKSQTGMTSGEFLLDYQNGMSY